MFRYIILLISIFLFKDMRAQSVDYSFLSYGTLPTISGVAIDWNTSPKIHFYDTKVFKGHSEFVSRGLGRKIRFAEFKKLTRQSKEREYLPFFLYDLKEKPYKNKSGTFNWAVRLENYNYDDMPANLAKEINKLTRLILETDKTLSEKGIIILSEGGNNSLSVAKLGKWLKKSSDPYLKLTQLIKHVEGKSSSVLNSGTAFGQLKLVKNEKDLNKLKETDIAVLKFNPIHIPPVAGIISLVPQTPLSHVNLLAKNRGTFNAYVNSINSIPNLKKLIGKYVKLYNEGDKILVVKIDKKQAEENQKKNPLKIVTIPEIKTDLSEIIELTKENEKQISNSYIGAKATNYYLLLKSLPEMTRPAYAIGFKYYFETIKGEPEVLIQNFLKEKNSLKKEEKTKSLAKIRIAIKESKSFPLNLITGIREILEKYPEKTKIRLRSSTNNEDLPEFNGAGLYSSRGFESMDSDDKLKNKILDVYSSLWTERAFQERDFFGIEHSKIGMAILIQEAFQKEIANGVIVTTFNPEDKIQIVVNAQSGEHSITNPEEGMQSESFVMNSTGDILQVYSESSLSPIFIENKINEPILKDLQEATLKLHSDFAKLRVNAKDLNKYGIDIEFKIMNEKGKNKLYFKQVRLLKY